MATKNTSELKTASVLAFERKLDPSDAVFSSGLWADRSNATAWPAVLVREKSVRGTISNRIPPKDMDSAKLDAKIENPNLQTVDVATLPPEADTLQVRFTVRVLGGAGVPSACNSAAYQQKLKTVMDGYASSPGFATLAQRYACNLANGRFLWRNRLGAEMVEVQVRHLQDGQAVKTWTFNALDFDLRRFDAPAASTQDLAELAKVVEQGLAGQQYALLEVTAFARVGAGQEVFPSQELILDKGSSTAGQKSKTLYEMGKTDKQRGTAAIHSQKLGNAIRTVDTWYPDEGGLGPIAVEPYGSVTSQGKAYRQPKEKQDFYTLLDSWVIKDQVPVVEQQHYVMANLIRGGVFGESGKD
ncbi:MAG: type I-F CRISPR-associated protein Csy3 [Burkholderiaceae bacterium]|nr:type I-F CRISPR-associated protein Csy3 [Burkholderiaceae bacterium]